MDEKTPVTGMWGRGAIYEQYVGRWSRRVAPQMIQWLAVAPGSRWLDVGCGTGALSQTVLDVSAPRRVTGIDRSDQFAQHARNRIADQRVRFGAGDAQNLPLSSASVDATVCGLMLNFVPQPDRAIQEMARVTRPGGVVGVYVWDYAGKMQFMRHFWNAAAALDPVAYDLDEGRQPRSRLCAPGPLAELFRAAGLRDVEVRPIDIDTHFRDFDDFWQPFLGGQGPAPNYVASLSEERRLALRQRLHDSLPIAIDGSVPLVARVWAARGTR